jgi:hypothetical protein
VPNGSISKRRRAALSTACLLAAGALALSGCAKQGSNAHATAVGTDAAVAGDTALPSASGSAAASASASVSASASASGSASPSASASHGASASASASANSSASGAASASAGGAAATAPAAAQPAGSSSGGSFTGLAFDTCSAPSPATMNAWRGTSPYGAVAVYIGGKNRGCSQPQLTASWVQSISASGWKAIPLYVGAQPPCQTGSSPEKITSAAAADLGSSDGADAVARAGALGMGAGSAIYLDMEAYNTSDTSCGADVLTYTQAFDRAVKARSYRPGFYGFASSSAGAIATAAAQGTADLPEALWYAKYDGNASTTAGFPFSGGLFSGRRGHQYQVNQTESYGGASLTIDRDAWDGPVAVTG